MTNMTGLDGPGDHATPTMAAAFPEVTARLVAVLHEMGYTDLANSLPGQSFYGHCHCKPGCSFVLTAPPGSSGSLMIWLETSGEIIGEASLDPQGRTITNFDLGAPELLGIPPNWLDHAASSSPTSQRPLA